MILNLVPMSAFRRVGAMTELVAAPSPPITTSRFFASSSVRAAALWSVRPTSMLVVMRPIHTSFRTS